MKKWLIVVVAVLIVGILAGYFIGQGGKSQEEKELGPFPGPQSAGSAPEIKYVPVAGAKGLEVEPKVIVGDWKQGVLSATVKIKNTRSEMLVTAKLNVYMNQSKWISSSFSVNHLKPGETITLNLRMLEVLNVSSIKKVEISFDERNIIWELTKSSTETEKPATVEPKQPAEKSIYTAADYPKNPNDPGGVTAAFFFYYNEKKYTKAEEFISQRVIQKVRAGGGLENWLENWYNELFQGRQLAKVELAEVEELEGGRDASIDFVILQFKDSSKRIEEVDLVKEDGKWKIDMIAVE